MNRKNKNVQILLVLYLCLISRFVMAISNYILPADTSEKAVKKMANRGPHKAAVMSALLPGLGQAYNKKYWKIPIIYAALGGMGYLVSREYNFYQEYHKELLLRYSYGDTVAKYTTHHPDPKLINLTTADINIRKLFYKKYLDYSVLGLIAVYGLNIIDATIDAHFKAFDVSDNLSLRIKPKPLYIAQNRFGIGAGISILLVFK